MVKINGKESDVGGMVIEKYLKAAKYDVNVIVIERNGDILPKKAYAETVMCDGDVIEIVKFVGGG